MIKTEDGEIPYGVYRFNQIIEECYVISKVIHTSYLDLMDISVMEKDKMLEFINEENKRNKEELDKIKRNSKH